ncbi:MAG: hypothetical protein GY711_04345 [bacterium]|nr:hypothetical protein [bacterium]
MKPIQRLLSCALVAGLAGPALGQVDYDGTWPWSQTAPSGPDSGVPGWWYNLGITGVRVELIPSAPKHLLVRYVFAGSPADGILQVGDVLTGAGGLPFVEDHQDGYGPEVFGAQGPIGEIAVALEAAQTQAGGGSLEVSFDRSGNPNNTVVPVGTAYGSFTPTYPFNCPKSAQIRAELLDYLVAVQGPDGSWGVAPQNTFAPLALLSSDEPTHRAAAYANVQYHAQTTRGDFSELHGLDNWRYMAAGIVLAEYYLQTGDADVLPELQEVHDFLARGQYGDTSQVSPRVQVTHPGSFPTTPEEQHGGWGHNPGFEGYGPISMTTGQGALVYSLMDRCGLTIRRSRHDAAYDFLKRGTGTNGYLWYEDEVFDNDLWADVGRTGASALANYLAPYPESGYLAEAQTHTLLMGTHSESFPDTHGSPTMGMGYAAAALAFDLPNLRRMLDANRYWFALAQCPDGSYYYQPNRDNAGYGADSRITASAVTAFIFSIPLQNLVVTGRP